MMIMDTDSSKKEVELNSVLQMAKKSIDDVGGVTIAARLLGKSRQAIYKAMTGDTSQRELLFKICELLAGVHIREKTVWELTYVWKKAN